MKKDIFTTGNMGRNIGRLREIMGMKQETLAEAIGVSRQTLSKLEQSTEIDEDKLNRIATALGVKVEAIKNFDEEKTINYVQNNYDGSNFFFGSNSNNSINPYDKVIELVEKNEKLYEQLLQSERDKIALMQRLIDGKKI